MKAYFAVGTGSVAARLLAGHRALISFAYVGTNWLRDKDIATIGASSSGLMIDSGAFTAWRQGKPIDPGAYLAWLAKGAPTHEHAIALDIIGDAEGSMRSWQTMRHLVPVWHEGDPVEHLDEYVSHGGLVALGRIEGRRSTSKTLEFYDAAFNRWPDVPFHALGNSNPATLEPYPFASFDSTSWERDAAYSNAAGWPYSRCAKETRQRAYIEATETIEHRQPRQLRLAIGRAGVALGGAA